MMRLGRIAGLALAAALVAATGCSSSSVAACEAQCAKRDECIGDVDVDQCRRACADSAPAGDDACVAAQDALSQCQVAQSCADFEAGAGCDAEAGAVTDACTAG